MSNFLFDRRVRLYFGTENNLTVVKDLKIEWDIYKTYESVFNSATLRVYNLNEVSRGILNKTQDKPVFVRLDFGYETDSDLSMLFYGNRTRSFTKYQPPNNITEIIFQDGEYDLFNSFLEKTYADNTSIATILNDIIKSIGLPVEKNEYSGNDKYQHGLTLSGNNKKNLDLITQKINYLWSVQDRKLQIHESDSKIGSSAYYLSPTTGLLNSPIQKFKGIEFDCLTIPKYINPGRTVQIDSPSLKGEYVIRTVRFTGNNMDGECKAHCTCDYYIV